MFDFILNMLSDYYLWIKAVHIMAVISWMAGLFYLPRLFVYHTRVEVGGDQDQLFQLMELKLLRIIMRPAMVVTWVFGLALVFTPGVISWEYIWVWVKALSVIAMTGFHQTLAKHIRQFAQGENKRGESFFRKINEVPTILMLVIVIMVIVRPF